MRKIIGIVLLMNALILQSCGKGDNCGECFSPPEPFVFELVDKEAGENLFTNGTFDSSDIQVVNAQGTRSYSFNFIDEDDNNLISIGSLGWETENVSVLIYVGETEILSLTVDAERLNENCCSFTRYNKISIENAETGLNEETGVYTVYVTL